MSTDRTWHALESDPDLWRIYMEKLGVDMNSLEFVEVYSLEEEFPPEESIFCFIFLYPDSGSSSNTSNFNLNLIQETNDENIWKIKQVEELDSCCCLIALLHCIGNNLDKIKWNEDSALEKFFTKTKTMNADERAMVLLNDENIHQAHEEIAREGQTEMLESGRVGHHYIAYILSQHNRIYEMNGSTRGPQAKCLGESTKKTFFSVVSQEIKRRVNELNGDIRFNLIGLSQK